MSGMQWHRVSHRNAASAARPQNLSGPVQELRWQGADSRDRQPRWDPERLVRTPEINRHHPLQVRRSINALPTIVDKSHHTLISSLAILGGTFCVYDGAIRSVRLEA